MKRFLAVCAAAGTALALAVTTPATAAPTPAPQATVQAAASQVVADGLDIPWAMAPMTDGGALLTERTTGRVWYIRPGQAKRLVRTIPGVVPGGEGGLLGIALSARFSVDKTYFVYYTAANDNRVAKVVYGSSAAPVVIVSGIRKAQIHNGGGLVVRSGVLYIGTGDAGDRSLPQNTRSLNGKILAVDYNGRAVGTNRYGRVFSIGHRNVQGFTSLPDSGALLATELGQDSQDELNWIRGRGLNYGWPVCEGVCRTAGYTDPIRTWPTSEASPSGISFVRNGSTVTTYMAALRGQRLWKMRLDGTTVVSAQSVLQGSYGRLRGVLGRGDRSLWITTSNGNGTDRVIRLLPAP